MEKLEKPPGGSNDTKSWRYCAGQAQEGGSGSGLYSSEVVLLELLLLHLLSSLQMGLVDSLLKGYESQGINQTNSFSGVLTDKSLGNVSSAGIS